MKRLILVLALVMLMPVVGHAADADMTAGNEIPNQLNNNYWFNGGFRHKVNDPFSVSTTTYTATLDDFAILTDATVACTLTLPTLATAGLGKVYIVGKDGDVVGTNAITIDGSGSETIMNGSGAEATTNTQIDASGDVLTIMAGSNAWIIIGQELQ